MKTGLIVCIILGFVPYYLSAQNTTTASIDSKENPRSEEKRSKFLDLIEFTIETAHSQRNNRSAILHSEADFGGKDFALNNDWSASHHRDYWNDRIASIEVPPGSEVWIYEYANFQGRALVITRDWSVHDNPWWRNRISSVNVVTSFHHEYPRRERDNRYEHDHRRNYHRESGVTLYKKKDLSGASMTIYDDWSVHQRDEFWNDCISGIHIPRGYEVIIYKHPHFQGRSQRLKGPLTLRGHHGFWDDWNNEISSVEIIRRW